MNVLLQMDLDESLIENICSVDKKVCVVRPESETEALKIMPEIEVVCGEINRSLFERRD